MPAGHTVRPRKWSNVIDLYDDRENSAIWGVFEKPPRCLGVRWNGSGSSTGYPQQSGYPLWYVEADFVTKMILLELRDRVKTDPTTGNLKNISEALSEFQP
jgi:hypothetical protein